MITIVRTVAACVATATLAGGLTACALLRRVDTTGVLVIRSHRALATVEEILRRAVDAEWGATVYLAFQNPEYLASFNRAEPPLQNKVDELQWLVADASEHEGIERLRVEIHDLFNTLRPMIKRTSGGHDGLPGTYDEMSRRMDKIHRLLREIRRVETERLAARAAADDSATRAVRVLTTLMTGICAAVATLALFVTVWLARPGWARSVLQ